MKKSFLISSLSFLFVITLILSSCGKREEITLSKTTLSFSAAGGTDHIKITANCGWTICIDENIHWFTVTPADGTNYGLITITVNNYEESPDREAFFTIKSASGKKSQTVIIHQNEIEINSITDCVWFVNYYERWNTDFYHNFIEDSYEFWSYTPSFDQTNWYFYFLPDSTGYQIRTLREDTVFYPYQYVYSPLQDSLYINFETTTDTVDDYHATIDALNAETFIFSDEWSPDFFEKISTVKFHGSQKATDFYINPNKISKKPHGPLMDVR